MTKHSSLGKALVKSRFSKADRFKEGLEGNRAGSSGEKWIHSADLDADDTDWNKLNLKSVTEQNSLDEFLTTAELAGTDFQSERLNLNFAQPKNKVGLLSKEETKFLKDLHEKNSYLLSIPRKPMWRGVNYDAQTLHQKERESFLEWRKRLALAQENLNLSMTPFEKNLEFWRQLWRVIDRSDVVVQIVDARNPLLFYCQDLEKYVQEIDPVNKLTMVLVNKSDFLTAKQRLEWMRHFEKTNTRVVFWSAVLASKTDLQSETDGESNDDLSSHEDTDDSESNQSKDLEDLEEDDEEEEDGNSSFVNNKFDLLTQEGEDEDGESTEKESEPDTESENNEDAAESSGQPESVEHEKEDEPVKSDPSDSNNNIIDNEKDNKTEEPLEKNQSTVQDQASSAEKEEILECTADERDRIRILSRDELLSVFKAVHKHIVDKAKPGCTTVGLVGYPNVGKSSTLNALLLGKKVAVSETPGKTKHYQTLYIDDELIICDCPGLVFPSFVSTRGELIINGILPIDQMRDYVEPINLILSHMPKQVFEMIYGIELKMKKIDEDDETSGEIKCSAERLCASYALSRGYMNHKGMPDVNRASRYLLKDYVNGKLLYCYPPPHIEEAESFQEHRYEPSKEVIYLERLRRLQKKIEERDKKPVQSEFDREFFSQMQPRALTKGGIVGYHRQSGAVQRGADLAAMSTTGQMTKSASKKHFNAHKREKQRRRTGHYDVYDY